jgi:hypothetical protein
VLNWFTSLFSSASNAVTQAIRDLIHAAVRGLYLVLHTVFGNVIKAWGEVWGWAKAFSTGEYHFILSVYNQFRRLFKALIPYLANYITFVYHWAIARINAVLAWLIKQILYYYHLLLSVIDAVRKWVINSVWRPLWNWLNTAWHWITHEGSTMYHYFTHLAAFAELLFWHLVTALEKYAWDAAKLLGRFFLLLVVRNVVRFASLMETIIDAIL